MVFSKNSMYVLGLICSMSIWSGCSNEISGVKEGVLPDYSNSLTVGQALEGWSAQECIDKKWENITTERGEKVVQYTCEVAIDALKNQEDMAPNISDDAYLKAKTDSEAARKTQLELFEKFTSRNDYDSPEYTNAKVESDNAYTAVTASEENVKAIGEHLARKQLKSGRFIIQFAISADGTSFEPNYAGLEYTFEDGKVYSEALNALVAAYKNQKIELGISIASYEARK